MNRPIITLLTDFGLSDHYVGAMKGVMLSICPEVHFVDITHEIPPYSILGGAFALSQAWQYFPRGTVHLVVVDPGVGSSRRAIVAEADSHRFVAPDNGVLSFIKPSRVYHIAQEKYFRKPVSQTFHGRDIFAPVAAHLAAGVPPADVGNEISDSIQLSALEPVETEPGRWDGIVLRVDRYGNVITNFPSSLITGFRAGESGVRFPNRFVTQHRCSYSLAEPGELFLISGSSGYLEVSQNQGNAAKALSVLPGTRLVLQS